MERKILIMGRSGSGKDTLAHYLTKDFNMKQLISTTTRPPRSATESTHVFVSEYEANKMKERVAETFIDGYQYFATKQQLDECDIYVIDPKGLKDVCDRAPDTDLCVVYVDAPRTIRKRRAMDRADDRREAARIFESRDADEDEMFAAFENCIFTENMEAFTHAYPTVSTVILIDNHENNEQAIREKASFVNLYSAQMSFGNDFLPHVHKI